MTMGESNDGSNDGSIDPLVSTLRTYFGYKNFRASQREVVEAIMEKENLIVLMPTGGGKSLTYALPAAMETGVTIVVCPILALINDQVARLRGVGLHACYVTHVLSSEEREVIFHHLGSTNPGYKVVVTTPETLLSPGMVKTLVQMKKCNNLERFVIDEAHCIGLWGNSFRESYTQLGALKDYGVQIVALTGSATDRTRNIIKNVLQISDARVISSSLNRPNIIYSVEEKGAKVTENIVKCISERFKGQSGIVYCAEIRETKDMSYCLNIAGVSAAAYYANLDPFDKQKVEEGWKEGRIRVICATVAFGMGIDKKDCRFVIHYTLSQDLEGYFQESGRAGRDGLEAHAILFYRFEDRSKFLTHITDIEDPAKKLHKLTALNSIVKYCLFSGCRRELILQYFGESATTLCDKHCDNCLNAKSTVTKDATVDAANVVRCLIEMKEKFQKVTCRLLMLTFRGLKQKDVTNKGFDSIEHFGSGKDRFSEKQAVSFIHELIVKDILYENVRNANERGSSIYLTLGPKAQELLDGKLVFQVTTRS